MKIPGPAKVAVSNLTEYGVYRSSKICIKVKDAGKKLVNLLGSLMTNTEEDGKVLKKEKKVHGLLNDIKTAGKRLKKHHSESVKGSSASLKRILKHGVLNGQGVKKGL